MVSQRKVTYRDEDSAANGHSIHKSGKTASHHMLLPSSSSTLETDSSRPTCNGIRATSGGLDWEATCNGIRATSGGLDWEAQRK